MTVDLSAIQDLLPSCCEADAADISALSDSERKALSVYSEDYNTVIVLAHHVQHSLEWIWYVFDAVRGGAVSPADLHLAAEAEKIACMLRKDGYHAVILPYPCRCGVRFKDLADKTGLGKIGDSFLFLHKEWGPWTHLRIMLTNAKISGILPSCGEVCHHCGKCIAACPAGAIKENTMLGIQCGAYQNNEYIKGHAYEYKCEKCIRACPAGAAPREIKIEYTEDDAT